MVRFSERGNPIKNKNSRLILPAIRIYVRVIFVRKSFELLRASRLHANPSFRFAPKTSDPGPTRFFFFFLDPGPSSLRPGVDDRTRDVRRENRTASAYTRIASSSDVIGCPMSLWRFPKHSPLPVNTTARPARP